MQAGVHHPAQRHGADRGGVVGCTHALPRPHAASSAIEHGAARLLCALRVRTPPPPTPLPKETLLTHLQHTPINPPTPL